MFEGPATKDTYTDKARMVPFLKELTLGRVQAPSTLRDLVPCYSLLRMCKVWS